MTRCFHTFLRPNPKSVLFEKACYQTSLPLWSLSQPASRDRIQRWCENPQVHVQYSFGDEDLKREMNKYLISSADKNLPYVGLYTDSYEERDFDTDAHNNAFIEENYDEDTQMEFDEANTEVNSQTVDINDDDMSYHNRGL